MKKTFKSILLATLGVFALTCCEDVPAPYQIPGTDKPQTATFYSSTNCSDWSMLAATSGNNPWSQGSSYTQATGYQKWDGADSKSNRMADGYLISPGFSTVTDKDAAYISFQYCVGYANNDAQFADHIKLYASTQYAPVDGFVAEKWTQLDWTATHTSTNWELATTTVVLPAEFLNQEKVNLAFYFTTPNETKSVTFEIKDLKVVAGTPSDNGGEGENIETTGNGTLESPYTVADALSIINAGSYSSNKVYVKGIVSAVGLEKDGSLTDLPGNSYGNATYFISDDGTTSNQFEIYRGYGLGGAKFTSADDLKVGDKVIVYGVLTLFHETAEMTTGSEIAELNGEKADDTPIPAGDPKGDGTETSPYNVAGINQFLDAGDYTGKEVYFEGIISSFKENEKPGNSYGNATFYISEDGKTDSEQFYVFRTFGFNGEKFTNVNQLKVGDKVVIRSTVTIYNNSVKETEAGKGVLISVNGKQEYSDGSQSGDEGGDNQGGDVTEYSIDLKYTSGTNFYDNGVATINDVADCKVLKIGTSKAAGNFTLTVPAGKHSFYAVTWKGLGTADVVLKNGEETIQTITVKENDGATQNSPYTITVTEEDKYEFEVASDVTLTVTSDKRIIFFGIK